MPQVKLPTALYAQHSTTLQENNGSYSNDRRLTGYILLLRQVSRYHLYIGDRQEGSGIETFLRPKLASYVDADMLGMVNYLKCTLS